MSEKMRRAHEIFDHIGFNDAERNGQSELDRISEDLWGWIEELASPETAYKASPEEIVRELRKIAGRLDDLDLSTLRGAA